jgi:hypothetical protein
MSGNSEREEGTRVVERAGGKKVGLGTGKTK